MSRKILKVDDVGASFPCGREGRHAERVNANRGIKTKHLGIFLQQILDGSGRQQCVAEAVHAFAARRQRGAKQRSAPIICNVRNGKPFGQSFNGFDVQRDGPLFASLTVDLQDAVFAVLSEVFHFELDEFTNPACGVSEDRKYRTISNAGRRHRIRCFKKASAVDRGESYRFAITRHAWRLNELPVCRIGADVAVNLQIRIQGAEDREFSANRRVRKARLFQEVSPAGDMLRTNADELTDVVRADVHVFEKLAQVAQVIDAGRF